ncbi:MAG: MBL fold metallo-hydrolase [Chloroflexota bacterium]
MVANLLNTLLHQPYSLVIIGAILLCMVRSNRSQRDNGDRAARIEEEFLSLGMGKIDEAARRAAARTIAGETDNDHAATAGNSEKAGELVALYREIKQAESLQVDFDRLPARDRLQWLKNAVENPESGFQNITLGMVLFGRSGFAVSALLKAYRDADKDLRDYARQKLEALFLAEKSDLITRDNVTQYLDELSQIQQIAQPYLIKTEKLKGTATLLQSFFFNLGCNIYALSYRKNGRMMHTLIDTGEKRYKPHILKLLRDNSIEPANIERILLTHHHFDHSGLVDVMCIISDARILVHPNFSGESIELDMSRFGKHIEWLAPAQESRVRNIGGLSFPILGEPVDIGEGARLEILGLPEGDTLTHTVDQLLFLYTPANSPDTLAKIGRDFKPVDEILFSGDLWLMHPPGFFEDTMHGLKISELIQQRRRRFDFRPQNRREKDALKKGFGLITVKPGHGPEFLGSRIMGTLLARRDILVKLGFDENEKKHVLNDREMDSSIRELEEKTYQDFLKELQLWLKPTDQAGFGYQGEQVAGFLRRMYREQTGGGDLVGQDRKERRVDLKGKLARLSADREQPEELRTVAALALSMIEKVP